MTYLLVSLLLITSPPPDAALPTCDREEKIVAKRQVPFPSVEFRRDAWGIVVVQFTIQPNGSTTDVKPLLSNSGVSERAATSLISGAMFAQQDQACSHSLVVELIMENRDWGVRMSPAPEDVDDPDFLNWISEKHKDYYGR